MKKFALFLILISLCFTLTAKEVFATKGFSDISHFLTDEHVLAQHEMPLYDRYPITSVSNVFKDNILLTLGYMRGKVTSAQSVNWDELHRPFTYEFTLRPGETFAFHDTMLPEYAGKATLTTGVHFDASEGFLSDGDIVGDGVCHLASLMNWAAQDAGLKVVAPTNHNFANIPDVPMQYGTAIYTTPGEQEASALQNLYISNTLSKPVKFVFVSDGTTIILKVEEE